MSLLDLNDNINNINKDVILDILLKCHAQKFGGSLACQLAEIGNVYVDNHLVVSDEEWEDVVKNPNKYYVYFKRLSWKFNYNIVHTRYNQDNYTDLYNMWYGGMFTMKHYILDYEQLVG